MLLEYIEHKCWNDLQLQLMYYAFTSHTGCIFQNKYLECLANKYYDLSLKYERKSILMYEVTQENSIKFLPQSSLLYISLIYPKTITKFF